MGLSACLARCVALMLVPAAVSALTLPPGVVPTPGPVGRLSSVELALLPEYCVATEMFARPQPDDLRNKWQGLLGGTIHHLHHYCWALVYMQRSKDPAGTELDRRAWLGRAIGDCMYVVDRAPPDFPLLPEILLRVGQFHATLGRHFEALEFFDRSRQAKADYWPPYVETANLNLTIGRRQHARDALKAGLAVMPEEPRLLEALKQLDARPSPAAKRKAN